MRFSGANISWSVLFLKAVRLSLSANETDNRCLSLSCAGRGAKLKLSHLNANRLRHGEVSGRLIAWAWAWAAVVCWGVMFPVGDLLLKKGNMSPGSVGFFRYLAASPILLGAAFASHGRAAWPNGLRGWSAVAALGLIGSAAMAQLLFVAQETVASVNASLLEAYVPMQVLLLSYFAGRRPTGRESFSVALGFAGSLFVLRAVDGAGVNLGALGRGDLYVFLSGLCWAIYTALGRDAARRMGPLPFTAWTVFFGAVWLFVFQIALGNAPTPPRNALEAWCIAFLAIFPTCVAFLGWNEAHRAMSLENLSFMEYLPPLVAAAAGAAFFGESVTAWQWAGIVAVISSAAIRRR